MVGPKSVQVRKKLVTWAPSNHKEGRNYTFWKTESQKYLMNNIWKYTTSTHKHDTKTQYLWQAGKKRRKMTLDGNVDLLQGIKNTENDIYVGRCKILLLKNFLKR